MWLEVVRSRGEQASGEEKESRQLTWLNRGRVVVVVDGCLGGRVGLWGLVLALLVVLVVLDDAAGHLLRVCDRDEVGRVQQLVVVHEVVVNVPHVARLLLVVFEGLVAANATARRSGRLELSDKKRKERLVSERGLMRDKGARQANGYFMSLMEGGCWAP